MGLRKGKEYTPILFGRLSFSASIEFIVSAVEDTWSLSSYHETGRRISVSLTGLVKPANCCTAVAIRLGENYSAHVCDVITCKHL